MRPFLGRRRALLALLGLALASGWAPQHSAAKHPRRLLGVRGVEAPNPPTSKARRTRARAHFRAKFCAGRCAGSVLHAAGVRAKPRAVLLGLREALGGRTLIELVL